MMVVIWNVRNSLAAWRYLVDELRPDVALLQKFTPRLGDDPPGQIVRAAVQGALWGSAVYLKQGTARELPLPAEHRG
jgi:hypothetical protein